jgi:signal transduction histidine kinase
VLGRAFVTLYFIVVVVILGAGWGLDKLYQSVANTERQEPINRAFFTLLESSRHEQQTGVAPQAALQQQLEALALDAQVLTLADLAQSRLKRELSRGELVALSAGAQRHIYYPMQNSPLVVRVALPPEPQRELWYRALLLLFYGLLALVIFLWTWPLVRDLRSLQQQAKRVGRSDGQARVSLAARSAVYPLSQEFNRMQQRIDEVLASYREMTYAVSHELRTPLARMKFALELAEGDVSDEQRARQMQNLRTDVAQMDNLISQLLNYAGFETQSQALTLQAGAPRALNTLLAGIIAGMQMRAGGSDAQATFTLIDNLGEQTVACEWSLMERVMQNLLANAAKYADHQVLITMSATEQGYQVTVEDDGPGVAPADRPRVFDSFVRLHQQPERDQQGFGLGLTIVQRIIDWHGGAVSVTKSETLGGACFVVRWPAIESV